MAVMFTGQLELVRTIAAKRRVVWLACADPEEPAGWFWPERFQPASLDGSLGGAMVDRVPDDEMAADYQFVAIEPTCVSS